MDRWTAVCIIVFVSSATLCPGIYGTTVGLSGLNITNTMNTTNVTNVTNALNTTNVTNAMNVMNITNATESNVRLLYYGDLCCEVNEAVCSSDNYTVCDACSCHCQLNYTFEADTGCVAVDGGGRVPGEPCASPSDCVQGLLCNNGTCACPPPCVYVKEKVGCDCGGDDTLLPILTGVILGIAIIVFWSLCICFTIHKHQTKRNKVSRLVNIAPGKSKSGSLHSPESIMFPIMPKSHSMGPAQPYPSQALAPISPLRPHFRPKSIADGSQYIFLNSAFDSTPEIHQSDASFPHHQHSITASNEAPDHSNSSEPEKCPSPAQESRKSSTTSGNTDIPPPYVYQPPNSFDNSLTILCCRF